MMRRTLVVGDPPVCGGRVLRYRGAVTRRALASIFLFAACTWASACQRIVQTQLSFADGSADLDRVQLVKIVEWIDRSGLMYAKFTGASVEAGASIAATGLSLAEAQELARRRAENTALALRILLPGELPIRRSSRAYLQKKQLGVSSNDFASVQLYPDIAALNLPDCNPIPIPGFDPERQGSPAPIISPAGSLGRTGSSAQQEANCSSRARRASGTTPATGSHARPSRMC